MCSIIGYSGKEIAAPILVKGLKRMEYRGYDSVGVATESDNKIELKKGTGKVNEVNSKIHLDTLPGKVGIGHTRWATHGKVTDINAHPHSSNSGKIAIVHNGIVENFEELKKQLESEGYNFKSETDSEVIVNLIQKNYELTGDVKETIMKTVSEIKGHYAFVAMFENGQLAAARFHEPLIVGVSKDNVFLSSDVLGFIEYTDNVIYMKNRNFIILDKEGFQILDFNGKKIKHEITKVSKEFGDAYKGNYAHFTLKEIYEQHETILKAGEKTVDAIEKTADYIKHAKNIYITGSGTSYNSALIAKQILSKYAKIKVEAIISSELQFLPDIIEENSILIAISQSGESADVLDAVRIAKKENCKIISIINLLTSSLARRSDVVIGMNCGPEIGVAATKSFTSQLVIIYKIVQKLTNNDITINFEKFSESILQILENPTKIQQIAKELKEISDIYVLGRGINYPIAIEAALKLKELTYIHAEGIPGGELKHGPLALMDSDVFVIIMNPNDSTYSDTITSAREIKARGAKIIGVSDIESDVYDYWIEIPKIDQVLYPISEIIPIQLLSYYVALEKETDPDYPRNLAKSVTVK
ncbi:glutamine--fructose-6-phosphate transaminase (isomerizing) [Marine Group I thaumarchaeote]|uniref:Glutamine--fructose-6-phosphate aminotransferase [isomerizing] n=1 Tax=Marine Group I thaumarchaeote TaxID=2511932 RepID=A0A7K4P342_9ARCH|nr:MAG: glutamine--fructose-6-phosphate transaminase (isomerizing) [Nitrosopumilus sp. YT1]NMI81788.1 glutamine--fructose-6-phosphate transaminase (isomerizing) [Candidatus Nitrosopumilus sp. MTA1]NWJ19726.1 glutamine--fructose-6-phosphate transaminase (isomerizing) [Marine Group I thaumarchaeote]NWJ56705.1 glutamine--fructose-6-phosphate transaminase (isomerizing) [Marine Group I thaumarchaeote]NWK00564.1 glutamine--fructose-6-phosphate transaminase (isomerizing) [Marine Group I thaumarchaeote